MGLLEGKVAIITGASKGIGRVMATRFGREGARVVCTARSADLVKETAAEVQRVGAKAIAVVGNAAVEDDVRRLVAAGVEAFGAIDILVNNAGGRDARAMDQTSDLPLDVPFLEARPVTEWRRMIDVNLTGVFLGCRAAVPVMKRAGGGKIVNIASTDGMLGRDLELYRDTGQSPTVPDYMVSKAGVINLTRAIAVTLAPYGIHVNCISPAGFERGQPPGFIAKYSKMFPLGRMGRDGIDLKGPVVLLCSHASDFIVGHNLVVDGGFTAW